MRSPLALYVAISFAALLGPTATRGIEPCEVARLTGDPAGLSSFGASAAISGDYIVVGDPGDDQLASWAGSAYVFKRGANLQWERQQKIFGSDTNFQDNFGYSVAIDVDRLVVGAPHNDPTGSDIGRAYVFQRSGATWIQQQQLVSSGSVADDHFGLSVTISGDVIVVGAPGFGVSAGYAYVFRWNGSMWVEDAALTNSHELFGFRVSLDVNRLLVSGEDETGAAAAFVLRYNGVNWTQEAKLQASDLAGGGFGASLSLCGDAAVIGAYSASGPAPGSGAAYAYRRSGGIWGNEQKLVAPDPDPFQVVYFGISVSINGNVLLIGASSDDDQAEGAGSVHLFELNQNLWEHRTEIHAANTSQGLAYGLAIGFDGSYAVVTANSSAYVYTVPHCIPAIGTFGLCILAGFLVIAAIALLRRGKLNFTL